MTFELTFQAKTENGTWERQTTQFEAASQHAADKVAREKALDHAKYYGYVDVKFVHARLAA